MFFSSRPCAEQSALRTKPITDGSAFKRQYPPVDPLIYSVSCGSAPANIGYSAASKNLLCSPDAHCFMHCYPRMGTLLVRSPY